MNWMVKEDSAVDRKGLLGMREKHLAMDGKSSHLAMEMTKTTKVSLFVLWGVKEPPSVVTGRVFS